MIMQRFVLKYLLAFFMIVQSMHGVWAATSADMMCETSTQQMTMTMSMMDDDMHHAMPDCQNNAQHKQMCVQACAVLHALPSESLYRPGIALPAHMMTHVALLTGISHRPLIPPPI
jgi:hypothetical protein